MFALRLVALVIIFPLSLALLAGCSSSSSSGPKDAARDRAVSDGSSDLGVDGAADLAPDGTADAGPDFPQPPEAGPDFPQVDASLSSATVLYITTKDPNSFGLREVSADGSAAPKPVSAFSGLVDFETLQLSGMQPSLAIDPARPLVEELVSFTRVRLPDERGHLYYFRRTITASSGILQIGTPGSPRPRILFEVPGLYSDVIDGQIAVNRQGTRAALVAKKREVSVLRTDGSTFPDGKTFRNFTTPADVTSVAAASLTLADQWLACVGTKSDNSNVLLVADLADGAAATLTVLPLLAQGQQPPFIADDPLLSRDGTFLLLRAGSGFTGIDLYRVPVGGTSVVNITKLETEIAGRGRRFGGNEARVAISPNGGRAAFVVRGSGIEHVYVKKGDGSGKLENPTKVPTFAAGGMSSIYNLLFLDEERLLFMAGVGPFQLDLYLWDASSDTVTNLSGIGSTTPPYDGMGGFSPRGAWLDAPSGRFYLVAYDSITAEQDLWGLPVAPLGAMKKLTQGTRVGSSAGDYALCPATRELYFVVRPDPTKFKWQLFKADLKSGTASPISNLGGSGVWQMGAVELVADCSRLMVNAGPFLSRATLHMMDTANPATLRPITAVPRSLGSTRVLTPDQSTVVYASGGSSDAMTLKAVLSIGSAATVLDTAGGTVHVLATY